jgi:hypothetical protein
MSGLTPRRDGEAPGAVFGLRQSARFAAHDDEVPGYSEEAYPALRVGSEGTTPDDIRVGQREPPPNAFVDIWPKPGEIDRQQRQADERSRGPFEVRQTKIPAPHVPQWTQERIPIRPTATQAPMAYGLTREWHIPRNVEDIYGAGAESAPGMPRRHASLADHRRKYAIMTQVPHGKLGVNTYRKDPGPWDSHLFNSPAPDLPSQGMGYNSIAGNRSYRSG